LTKGPWKNVNRFMPQLVKSGIKGYFNNAEIPVVSAGGLFYCARVLGEDQIPGSDG